MHEPGFYWSLMLITKLTRVPVGNEWWRRIVQLSNKCESVSYTNCRTEDRSRINWGFVLNNETFALVVLRK